MTDQTAITIDDLVINRTINADRTTVYQAFADVDQMSSWWGPKGIQVTEATWTATAGDAYRVVKTNAEGGQHILVGKFLDVIENEKLVYTWAWEADGVAGHESTVTLLFTDTADGKTQLAMTHQGLPSVEAVNAHNGGWSSSLDRLEEKFAA